MSAAVLVVYNSSVTIESSTLANNTAGDADAATALGGGIYAEGSATLAITESLFLQRTRPKARMPAVPWEAPFICPTLAKFLQVH